mmetsp:Transcript_56792/g.133083  ORF Transcript_56792/g.133083 Transcript_56792/m.133083 type:complete len:121 (-) Transcript_56792:869-1231(-)
MSTPFLSARKWIDFAVATPSATCRLKRATRVKGGTSRRVTSHRALQSFACSNAMHADQACACIKHDMQLEAAKLKAMHTPHSDVTSDKEAWPVQHKDRWWVLSHRAAFLAQNAFRGLPLG